ncbi:hypothetical protein COU61_04825 [Candidatus Pacearchaeota archaeon CG10_big_fil_rev_8_21_14_0_10_35_13]|nr:MAG: hypothetical protein COU61_04825 [Candidatus Pacearchaeota archaeon CG10_big_fil_rev_8_21_14_0_10_35_13]
MLITFENPQYLALLLAVPLLITLHFYSMKQHRSNALKFANFDAINRITGIEFFSKNLTLLYLSIMLIMTLGLANAGMHMQVTKNASGFSYIIDIDSSQSMETSDVPGALNRFEAAKNAAREFVNKAPTSTEIGVISFSGTPFIEQEPTRNKAPVIEGIDKTRINRVGGTNILNAIVSSGNLFSDDDTKAVILISDGQLSIETTADIIKYANQNEIVINTIGIGSLEGAENNLGYVSKLDEEALQGMAYETKGKYARVTNQEEFNNAIIEILDISKRKADLDMRYPLITISTILFLIIFYLSNVQYKSIP